MPLHRSPRPLKWTRTIERINSSASIANERMLPLVPTLIIPQELGIVCVRDTEAEAIDT